MDQKVKDMKKYYSRFLNKNLDYCDNEKVQTLAVIFQQTSNFYSASSIPSRLPLFQHLHPHDYDKRLEFFNLIEDILQDDHFFIRLAFSNETI